MSDRDQRQNIVVVGAGVVGTCCALEAAMRGHRVRLIDLRAPGTGTSFGNAGSIASMENAMVAKSIAMRAMNSVRDKAFARMIKQSHHKSVLERTPIYFW